MAEVKPVPTLNRPATVASSWLLMLMKRSSYTAHHGTAWDNANSIVREAFGHRTCESAFYGKWKCRLLVWRWVIPTLQQKPRRHGSSGIYDSIVVEPGLINGHHHKQQVHQ